MTEVRRENDSAAERFRFVADGFTTCARTLPSEAWDCPCACEGWTGRDVVDHLIGWVPAMLSNGGVEFPSTLSSDDPVTAWENMAVVLQAALDDPSVAQHNFDVGPPGEMSVEAAISQLITGDVFVHTWDLGTAAGWNVRLDPVVVHEMLVGLQPMDEARRSSGHFGPRVEVASTDDEQTQLLAFLGRRTEPAGR
jgi:uncharacterized protein (TIGR03086 family)